MAGLRGAQEELEDVELHEEHGDGHAVRQRALALHLPRRPHYWFPVCSVRRPTAVLSE